MVIDNERGRAVMEYRGYNIIEKEDGLVVENIKDFNPVHIFECGQCFRWLKENDGSYTGVAGGRVANISYSDGRITIKNASQDDFIDMWFDYLDLGRDYSEVKKILSKDPILEKAIEFGYGIRILRQDIWETLISFIISANNMIPRIMKTVAVISKVYGDEISYAGKKYFTFPGIDKLAGSSLQELDVCRGGFRCKYILGTAHMIKEGVFDLEALGSTDTDEARKELTRLPGVGNKVADCVLLYSGTKQDVFPTDVWVKRVMEELYFKREASFKEIQEFAREHFGELAGFAQQYLFYYAREKKIGAKSVISGRK